MAPDDPELPPPNAPTPPPGSPDDGAAGARPPLRGQPEPPGDEPAAPEGPATPGEGPPARSSDGPSAARPARSLSPEWERARERRMPRWPRWLVPVIVVVALAGVGILVWLFAFSGGGGVTLSSSEVDFGEQDMGAASQAQSITVENGGDAVEVLSLALSGPQAEDFVLAKSSTCVRGESVGSGGSCAIDVRFRPSRQGTRTATLVVNFAGDAKPVTVALRGTGVGAAVAAVSKDALDFGTVVVGRDRTRKLVFRNDGNAPLRVREIRIQGKNRKVFALTDATECRAKRRLKPGASCALVVSFSPARVGEAAATLVIVHGAEPTRLAVVLAGRGRGLPGLEVEPSAIDFGRAQTDGPGRSRTVTVSSTGTAELELLRIRLGGDDIDAYSIEAAGTCEEGQTLAPAESCSVELLFAPSGTGSRTASLLVEARGGLDAAVAMEGRGRAPPNEQGGGGGADTGASTGEGGGAQNG